MTRNQIKHHHIHEETFQELKKILGVKTKTAVLRILLNDAKEKYLRKGKI